MDELTYRVVVDAVVDGVMVTTGGARGTFDGAFRMTEQQLSSTTCNDGDHVLETFPGHA
jgi:hypothetical protein